MTDPASGYPDPSKRMGGGFNQPPSYFQQQNMQPGVGVAYGQPAYVQPVTQVQYITPMMSPAVSSIRDWLPWSIVNIFIGWLFAGILPLIFSLMCRSYKLSNNESGARTMSTLALVFNILITLGGLAGWITLIVLVTAVSSCVTSYGAIC